tara:strand:+ start:284 stop:385 length:102 start_codon:yes stop_codon:yes gene_type:complete
MSQLAKIMTEKPGKGQFEDGRAGIGKKIQLTDV